MHSNDADELLERGVKPATYHRHRKVGFLLFQPLSQVDRNTWLFAIAPQCGSYYNICAQRSLHMSLLLAREEESGHWLEIIQWAFRHVRVCAKGLGKVREIKGRVSMRYSYCGILSHNMYIYMHTRLCTRDVSSWRRQASQQYSLNATKSTNEEPSRGNTSWLYVRRGSGVVNAWS